MFNSCLDAPELLLQDPRKALPVDALPSPSKQMA
jgi:hypothetical protein